MTQHNATLDNVRTWLAKECPHHECEDCWYSCAKLTCDDRRKSDKCDCGADEENVLRLLALDLLSSETGDYLRGLEDAAMVCEEWPSSPMTVQKVTCLELAAAIRALRDNAGSATEPAASQEQGNEPATASGGQPATAADLPLAPTKAMIEAGAQRAERVWRSMGLVAHEIKAPLSGDEPPVPPNHQPRA